MKRIRPAPMGRAFRYQRRMSHLAISIAEHATDASQDSEGKATGAQAKKAPAKKASAKKASINNAAAKKPAAKKSRATAKA